MKAKRTTAYILLIATEERLYAIQGEVLKEYLGGNFQKTNRRAVELFAKDAKTAAVYPGECQVKMIGKWHSLSKDGKRAEYIACFNLADPEQKKVFFRDYIY